MNKEMVEQKNKEFVKTYDSSKYQKPSVTVDMLIFTKNEFDKLELLLITRKKPPYQDCYALPGGFLDINESLEEAAQRELEEETSIKNVKMTQLHAFSKVDRDPRMRVISVAYYALVNKADYKVKASDDALTAKWYEVELNNDKLTFKQDIMLAFDHEEIIKMGLRELNKNYG